MSSIHYKLKSTIQYKTLSFDGLHISVDDLKRVICEKENIKTESFDLILTNAHTKRQYSAEDLVPRNSSVLVQRIPRENALKLPKVQDTSTSGVVLRSTNISLDNNAGYIQSEEFSKMTEEQRLAHVKEVSYQKYQPSNYQKKPSAIMSGPPPPTYVCNRCSQPGHWFKNCPLLATRRTTGIPMEELMETTKDDPLALLHPSGKYVVPIMHFQARQQRKQENFILAEAVDDSAKLSEVPPELACPLCKSLLREAVLATCCGDSFCADCAQQLVLDDKRSECPGAGCNQKITSDSLVPNNKMRQAVQKFLSTVNYSSQQTTGTAVAGANKPDVSNTSSLLHRLLPDLVQPNLSAPTAKFSQPHLSSNDHALPKSAQPSVSIASNFNAPPVVATPKQIPSQTSFSSASVVTQPTQQPPSAPLVDFSVPPPPVITTINSSLSFTSPMSVSLTSAAVKSNGVEIWAPNANVLVPPPNLAAPPPLISHQQTQIYQNLSHQNLSQNALQSFAASSSPHIQQPAALLDGESALPPGASSSSSSSSSSSASSSSSESSNSRRSDKKNVKRLNELNNAWETLLKRTEDHSVPKTFHTLHPSPPGISTVNDVTESTTIVSAQGISDAWESFIKNKYEKKRPNNYDDRKTKTTDNGRYAKKRDCYDDYSARRGRTTDNGRHLKKRNDNHDDYFDRRAKPANNRRQTSRTSDYRSSYRDETDRHSRRGEFHERSLKHRERSRPESRERRGGGDSRFNNDDDERHGLTELNDGEFKNVTKTKAPESETEEEDEIEKIIRETQQMKQNLSKKIEGGVLDDSTKENVNKEKFEEKPNVITNLIHSETVEVAQNNVETKPSVVIKPITKMGVNTAVSLIKIEVDSKEVTEISTGKHEHKHKKKKKDKEKYDEKKHSSNKHRHKEKKLALEEKVDETDIKTHNFNDKAKEKLKDAPKTEDKSAEKHKTGERYLDKKRKSEEKLKENDRLDKNGKEEVKPKNDEKKSKKSKDKKKKDERKMKEDVRLEERTDEVDAAEKKREKKEKKREKQKEDRKENNDDAENERGRRKKKESKKKKKDKSKEHKEKKLKKKEKEERQEKKNDNSTVELSTASAVKLEAVERKTTDNENLRDKDAVRKIKIEFQTGLSVLKQQRRTDEEHKKSHNDENKKTSSETHTDSRKAEKRSHAKEEKKDDAEVRLKKRHR